MATLLKETILHFRSHNAQRMSAALSYYLILSFVPLLFLIMVLCTSLFDLVHVQTILGGYVETLLGNDAAAYIVGLLGSISLQSISFGSAIVTALVVIIGSLSVFSELKKSLSELWGDPKLPRVEPFDIHLHNVYKRGMGALILTPILSLLFVLSISITILLTSLEVRVEYLPSVKAMIQIAHLVLPFIFGTSLFVAIYRIMPEYTLPWKMVIRGAAATALLFLLGDVLVTSYLKVVIHFHRLGSATSLIGLFFWVYYCSLVFFFGSSLTYIYAKRRGVTPSRGQVQSILPPLQ